MNIKDTFKGFKTTDISRISRLHPGTLHFYNEVGAYRADIDLGVGVGSRRRHSNTNLIEAIFIERCISLGLPRKLICSVLTEIRDADERHLLEPKPGLPDPSDGPLFLIIQKATDGGAKHRFLRSGGRACKNHAERYAADQLTSSDEREDLASYLLESTGVAAVINITNIIHLHRHLIFQDQKPK